MPVLLYVFYEPGYAPPDFVTYSALFISLLILVKHKANIERLIAGQENRLNKRK
jgi:glycerol-3-phosphate acyltransferase PlsY